MLLEHGLSPSRRALRFMVSQDLQNSWESHSAPTNLGWRLERGVFELYQRIYYVVGPTNRSRARNEPESGDVQALKAYYEVNKYEGSLFCMLFADCDGAKLPLPTLGLLMNELRDALLDVRAELIPAILPHLSSLLLRHSFMNPHVAGLLREINGSITKAVSAPSLLCAHTDIG